MKTKQQPYLGRTPRVLVGAWVPASKRLEVQELSKRKGQSVSTSISEAVDLYLRSNA